MLGLHKTKDHRSLPIVTMSTGHIINYLNLSLRQITAMVTQCHKKSSGLVARLARIQETKVTQEDIDRACIDFLEEKAPYIAELMRRALFLDDEKAKLFVHKIFSQVGEDLLTNLEGSFTPLQIAPKRTTNQVLGEQIFSHDDDDYDYLDLEDQY